MGKSLLIFWLILPCSILHSQSTAEKKQQQASSKSYDSLFQLSKTYFREGKFAASNEQLQLALKIAEQTGDSLKLPSIYNSLGNNYCYLLDLTNGMEFYYKAMRLSEQQGNKKEMANAYQYIGSTYLEYHDDSIALQHLVEAARLNKETGNEFGYAQNNNTVAEIYLRTGRYTEALDIFRESLRIYEKNGAPSWGIPWTLQSIGTGYEYLGDSLLSAGNTKGANEYYEIALNYFIEALEKSKTRHIKPGIAEQHLYIGGILFKLKHLKEARSNLQTALSLFEELGSTDMAGMVYQRFSRIDSAEGNYEKAYEHFKLATLYRDSVYNDAEYRKLALYKTKHEIEKKEEEIKLLAAENKFKAAVAQKQQQQKLFAYAAILLIIFLGIYSFYRFRLRKRSEMEQAILNDRLNISQGLHDDIGSTLSSISVYTHVAQKLSEKNRQEDLAEMLSRIKSTSSEMISEMNDIVWTIHPRNDNMEKIILRMESYARPMLTTRNIEFKLEYDPLILTSSLDMEKRKNFYLLFKEAVNNAFKYSGCSEITTRLSNSKGKMEMLISDNGVGFDTKQELDTRKLTLSGNGLRNMKMRAEEMKGDLQIESNAATGTQVRLRIPLP